MTENWQHLLVDVVGIDDFSEFDQYFYGSMSQ